VTAAAVLEDTHDSWLSDAVATIIGLAHVQTELTADDLRREIRPAPHANLVGIAFTTAKRAGHIEAVSYQTSTSKTRKHGALRTWRRKTNEGAGNE
jgi:hypothetical protein